MLDSYFPGCREAHKATYRLYREKIYIYICVFVCVYVHMLSATSVRSLLFYEADQTQGVIVIYEAPRCLWRVRLDLKHTLPCQVHSVSTSRHLLCISCFIGRVQNYNSRSKLTILLFFRMTVKSLSGVTAHLHWKIMRGTWWNPWMFVKLMLLDRAVRHFHWCLNPERLRHKRFCVI